MIIVVGYIKKWLYQFINFKINYSPFKRDIALITELSDKEFFSFLSVVVLAARSWMGSPRHTRIFWGEACSLEFLVHNPNSYTFSNIWVWSLQQVFEVCTKYFFMYMSQLIFHNHTIFRKNEYCGFLQNKYSTSMKEQARNYLQ